MSLPTSNIHPLPAFEEASSLSLREDDVSRHLRGEDESLNDGGQHLRQLREILQPEPDHPAYALLPTHVLIFISKLRSKQITS